jgi:nucleotidyltransferase substrate binding protein (TIGR01987 family)
VNSPEPARWAYRLDAYRRALSRLTEAVEAERSRGLSDLEQMGLVQSFEFTVELGWKLMGDVLDAQGLLVPVSGPNAIIRASFEARILADGRGWLRAVQLRNELPHIYREELFIAVVGEIVGTSFEVLRRLPDELDRLGVS